MATAEGVFPKVGNDPIYASEVNLFNPKIIGQVIQATNTGSATVVQNAGTPILYSGAGPSQISNFIIGQFEWSKNGTAQTTDNTTGRVVISGAGLNNMIIHTKNISNTQGVGNTQIERSWGCNFVLTSGVITASGGNVGSSYVIQPQTLGTGGWINDFLITGQ